MIFCTCEIMKFCFGDIACPKYYKLVQCFLTLPAPVLALLLTVVFLQVDVQWSEVMARLLEEANSNVHTSKRERPVDNSG